MYSYRTETLPIGYPYRSATRPASRLFRSFPVKMVAFMVAHVPLVFIMRENEVVATLHVWVTLGIGIYLALTLRGPYLFTCLIAYFVGAELLWRMTSANVFWEMGKYGAGFMLLLGILRQGRLKEANKLPLLYFALLLPSVLLMLPDRQSISFNMSGPFLLAIAVFFFSTIHLTKEQMQRVLLFLLVPIIAAAMLAVDSTIAYEGPLNRYSKATAGGIGQNQMTTMLGLGMLAAAFYVVTDKRHRWFRFFIAACGIVLATQALITLSRGGLLTGLGAIIVASFYLIRNKRLFGTIVFGGLMLYVVSDQVLIPFVDDLTGGAMSARYQKAYQGDTTGRWDIMLSDLKIFWAEPYLGVGPGGSKIYRIIHMNAFHSAHTEFSRILAEHGLLGLGALAVLLFMAFQRVLRSASILQKAFSVAFLAWAIATMMHSAMRLAAPAFMFGLAFVLIHSYRRPGPRGLERHGDAASPRRSTDRPGPRPRPAIR